MNRLSPFTLIVTFVCLALVGLALVPIASGQAESVAHIAGLYGAL